MHFLLCFFRGGARVSEFLYKESKFLGGAEWGLGGGEDEDGWTNKQLQTNLPLLGGGDGRIVGRVHLS